MTEEAERPLRIPAKLREEMWNCIEDQLQTRMVGKEKPYEIATTFNSVLYFAFDEIGRNGYTLSLRPEFVGEYEVDQSNPFKTRVFSHQGTEACSPIDIRREIRPSIIGRTVRTGLDQYVPDVRRDPDHMACSSKMGEHSQGGTETVLLSWSEPYSSGSYRGLRVPLGVLDIDLKVIDAFSADDVNRLRRIWRPYGKLIFPGEPEFEITPELEARYEFIPKNKRRKQSA